MRDRASSKPRSSFSIRRTTLREITDGLGIPFIFKSSFDKANRSSHESYRGPGIDEGLRILEKVKSEVGVPVLTDVHEDTPLDAVADVVSVLQTPAFLCRQTNFIRNVCAQGLPVNIKKGQFLAPLDMVNVVNKARATGNQQIMVCERGVSFGYNNLVSDMRSLAIMRSTGCPVVYDATHSVQMPGGLGTRSGRPARDGAGAGARSGRRRHLGRLHGDASESRQRACPMDRTRGRCIGWRDLLRVLVQIDRDRQSRWVHLESGGSD